MSVNFNVFFERQGSSSFVNWKTRGYSVTDSTSDRENNQQKAKILVIDHHLSHRMIIVAFLTVEGYQVFETGNSQGILTKVQDLQPDLMLLETSSPQGESFEIGYCLKSHETTQHIPIIFISQQNEPHHRIRAIEAGGDDYFTSPFDPLELSLRIQSLLRQKRHIEKLNRVQDVLISIAGIAESRDQCTGDHCKRCATLAQAFGRFLHLSKKDIHTLKLSGFLHDIGKIGIPDHVLQKNGSYTPEEWEIMKQHAVIGERICRPIYSLESVLPIIRHHHERWDGSGYPDGLIGDEIPYLAQVFQLIDIYDALMSERPYKPPLPQDQVLNIIAEESRKGWRNPQLVKQFIEFISIRNPQTGGKTSSSMVYFRG